MSKHCPGADGLSCIDGWLYSSMPGRMMIFPANKKCPTCNKEAHDDGRDGADDDPDMAGLPIG